MSQPLELARTIFEETGSRVLFASIARRCGGAIPPDTSKEPTTIADMYFYGRGPFDSATSISCRDAADSDEVRCHGFLFKTSSWGRRKARG